MNDKKTESLCISSIVYHLLRASAVGISYTNILIHAKENGYMSIIIGFVLGFIPLLMYMYIMDYNPDLNIIDINENIFGKRIGRIINILLCIFILSFVVITFWNLGDFINSQFLNSTPTYIITSLFLLPIIYALTKGINTISRTSLILFYLNIIGLIIISLSLVGQVEWNNLLPFMENGIMPILKGSYNFIGYNLLPLFLITIIPKNKIVNKEKFKKQIITMYSLSSIAILAVIVLVTGTFGINLVRIFAYPEYHVLKRIELFSSIQRIETMLSLTWLFAFFITLSMGIYYICENIYKILNINTKKKKNIAIIDVSLLSLILSEFIFDNHTQASKFLLKIYPSIIYIFLLIIPAIIFIRIKIIKNKS